jgi:thiol-disulfide isomerase/thioredoxin
MRSMAERTWADAIGEFLRSARRHKIISAIVVLCVAGSLAGIGLASSASGKATPVPETAAAAFSLPELGHAGKQVSLNDYQGKPVIVNFFASWCAPCKTETPLLAKFYRTEKGKVALVGLDENDVTSNAMAFARADGVTYPVGWDPHTIAASGYGIDGLPQTFFLNARHRIVDHIFGAVTMQDLNHGIALATASS